MKRKLFNLSLIICTIICIFAIPQIASAATEGKYTYTVSNGEATITGISSTNVWELTLPSTLGGYPVTSIGVGAFEGCKTIYNVIVPDGITSIGDDAFYNATSLVRITLPNTVTTIGDDAFSLCSLESITIPDSVTYIGGAAFRWCEYLKSINIPDSVNYIGNRAFSECTSLTSILVDENNIFFSSCDGNLYDKSKSKLIQYAVGKDDLSFSIPDTVTSIGDSAFCNCSSLTSINIPDSVTSIGNYAFYDCWSLTNIIVPDSVVSIGYSAFYDTAFYNDEKNWTEGVLYSGNCLIEAKDTITACDIRYGTKLIVDEAFYSCDALADITFPDSITSIGSYAFSYCDSLTSITIPDNITHIGDGSFSGCKSLTNILVDENNRFFSSRDGNLYDKSQTKLISYANGRTNSSFSIPNTVTSIGDGAFFLCSLTSITIPDSVISIGKGAFMDCDYITSINIPDGVTSIGDSTFLSCSSLTSITIPNTVTSIGSQAFSSCSSLTGITIPNTVTSIGYGAFSSCSSLTGITIPNSVTYIGAYSFYYCSSLTNIYYDGTKNQWNDIDIRDGNSQLNDAYLFTEYTEEIPALNVACKKENENYKFKILLNKIDEFESADILTALYDDNNKIIKIDITKIYDNEDNATINVATDKEASSYKIMLLDGKGNLKPLCVDTEKSMD